MDTPQVRLLHTDGCSPENTETARAALEEALAAVGLPVDGYEVVLVGTEEEALALGFVGGPAVLVNGVDADPNVRDMRPGGLGCRAYLTPAGITGAPAASMIETALREALKSSGAA
ncbi:MAG: DF family (seleno)protein [Thermoleophilia bacterium]